MLYHYIQLQRTDHTQHTLPARLSALQRGHGAQRSAVVVVDGLLSYIKG